MPKLTSSLQTQQKTRTTYNSLRILGSDEKKKTIDEWSDEAVSNIFKVVTYNGKYKLRQPQPITEKK